MSSDNKGRAVVMPYELTIDQMKAVLKRNHVQFTNGERRAYYIQLYCELFGIELTEEIVFPFPLFPFFYIFK